MAAWSPQYPIDFTANGDRTNGAIAKQISEIARIYGLLAMLRNNFSGAGFPSSPERNQLYINPNTLEAWVYVGASGANDWRQIVSTASRHDLDKHNPGTMQNLQDLVSDAFLVNLASAPALADNGKILSINVDGDVVLSSLPATYAPSVHDHTKHSPMTLAQLQSLVSDKALVYLAAAATAADSAKIVSVDSNGNFVLTSPAAQTDALNAPYEKVEAHGTISVDTTIAASDGNIHTFTVGGNITLTLNPNCLTGFCRTLTLVITNGGAYTITWPASVKWAGGSAPTFTASGVDIVTLITVDAGTTWYGSVNGVSYA
jgi:hypothetical protein